ncbi:MAG TPA: class I SAM-dependent methyltransferase [Vicinamibacteria bacterium]|nr:class I SAM-dependent methyltransferase [Vicinamibacteria bacterium]
METPDPFRSFHADLEARHLAELTFPEVRRALQALSSLYVERRERMAGGAALDGAGKRAAFALYYGPLHFLLVREIVRALGARGPRRVLDLGCGTGTAGAAWALECEPRARIDGVDRSGWAVAEARWTFARLGLDGRATRGDAVTASFPGPPAGILAAFTVNELGEGPRRGLLPRLLDAGRRGSTVLVVEPIARGVNPWWPVWAEAFRSGGGREDEWRFRPALPPRLALLGKAAALDSRELTGRSLVLPGGAGLVRPGSGL